MLYSSRGRCLEDQGEGGGSLREPLDQRELMRDLAALGLNLLLRVLQLLRRSLGLESDLLSALTSAANHHLSSLLSLTYVVGSRHLDSLRITSSVGTEWYG